MNPPSAKDIPKFKQIIRALDQELGFLPLLKETLKIPFRNLQFTCLILFTSLPLLFLMIFFEILLEKTVVDFLKFSNPSLLMENYWLPLPYYLGVDEMTWEFSRMLIFLPLVYLFPLHILEFLASFLTINLASKMYKDHLNRERPPINRERLKGSFLTSLYALFLSTSFLLGFIWFVTGYCNLARVLFYDLIFTVFFLAAFIALFPKYLKLNAAWNMSLVVSVLEEIQGIDALSVSFSLCEENQRLGRDLMLAFFVWGFGLRIPCLFFNDGEIGVIGRTSFLWMGNLMKWVACVVYYHHCKSKVFSTSIDMEAGGSVGYTDSDGLHKNDTNKQQDLSKTEASVGSTDNDGLHKNDTNKQQDLSKTVPPSDNDCLS